ncbi:MAG: hypothetical protein Kow0067_11040 [Coriobacteriia bacterium]
MNCPNCGKPFGPDQAFCGECGAALPEQPQAPEPGHEAQPAPAAPEPVVPPQPTQPIPHATQPMPPAAQPPVPPPYGQQPPTYPPAYGQQPYVQPPATPAKKGKGCLIAAIIGVVVVVLLGLVVGGYFVWRAMQEPTTTGTTTETPATGGQTETPSTGFATADEAVQAEIDPDWVYTVQRDDGNLVTYWIGPPNSEYVEEVLVEQQADGSWIVVDAYPIGQSDVPGDMSAAEAQAVDTVTAFLSAIMADDPQTAQSLTIEPFKNDPASASYSNGDFYDFFIMDTEMQDDGTVWVYVEEEWAWGVDRWAYYTVPTELGYYISDISSW